MLSQDRIRSPGDAFADAHAVAPCWLTADIPGVGGEIKQRPEDFFVEELPLYQPSGDGEHIYLFVEKRSISSNDLVGALAKHFGVKRRAIGYAGLKDKHAITRQVFSVHTPGKTPEDFPMFQHNRATVLWADLHANKLKRGHLAGNRFSIRVRGVEPAAAIQASRALERLAEIGAPNRIGTQRFGYLANNHVVGRAMIRGEIETALDLILGPSERSPLSQQRAREHYAAGEYAEAADALPSVYRNERRALRKLADGKGADVAIATFDPTAASFYISSFQSAVFNAVLDHRLTHGSIGELGDGDLAWIHKSRRTYAVDADVLAEEDLGERLGSFAISPSGPMWGSSMQRASGAVGRAELDALEASGVTLEQIEAAAELPYDMVGGDRRPLRVPVIAPEVEGGVDEHGSYIRCAFDLPRGSFATTVMDEIMKPTPAEATTAEPTHG